MAGSGCSWCRSSAASPSRGRGAAQSLAIFAGGRSTWSTRRRSAASSWARSGGVGRMADFCRFCGADRALLEGSCWKGGRKAAEICRFLAMGLCLSGLRAVRCARPGAASSWAARPAPIGRAAPPVPPFAAARCLAPSRARVAEFGSTFPIPAHAPLDRARANLGTVPTGRGGDPSRPSAAKWQRVRV